MGMAVEMALIRLKGHPAQRLGRISKSLNHQPLLTREL